MIDVVEVLQKIYAHVRGDMDLPSFRDWMVQAQFELEGDKGHAAELLWRLEILYSEHIDGLADASLWKRSLVYMAEQERPGTESFLVASIFVPAPKRAVSFGTLTATCNSIPKNEPELQPA